MISAVRGAAGVAWVDLAISGGERVSPADAYLRPVLHRPNLVVETGCLVTGLRLRGGRCTGPELSTGRAAGQRGGQQ